MVGEVVDTGSWCKEGGSTRMVVGTVVLGLGVVDIMVWRSGRVTVGLCHVEIRVMSWMEA